MMSLTLLLFGLCGLLVIGIAIAVLVIWSQNRQVGEQTPASDGGSATPDLTTAPADLEAQVRWLVQSGNKIEAIKVYRQATGVELKEAREAVEAVERGRSLLAPAGTDWESNAVAQPATPAQLEAEIRELVQKGNKLAAIALYRSATQSGLKEAKDAVEAVERGEPLLFPELGTVASPDPASVPGDFEAQITDLLRQGRKIDAIKLYREATGVGLAEAKEIMEAIERRQL